MDFFLFFFHSVELKYLNSKLTIHFLQDMATEREARQDEDNFDKGSVPYVRTPCPNLNHFPVMLMFIFALEN